ncbi:hypothetical protein [Cytobacillus sp. IB215316]|uniref:hypothetical protein n=1 Tax=Cytobacillus sp. IB215316 TaxID=3097354 RepID=UPI002A100345|nr:hypothetical protein [Cytobacillus sp. IB215316]MDX8363436.1 hypothetical protein [Cytobacillus sp. IB215316]
MNTCPICGYDGLFEPAYDKHNYGSHEICPCCGFQYGYSDDHDGSSFEDYRKEWIEEGYNWYSNARRQPKNWNPKVQLEKVLK